MKSYNERLSYYKASCAILLRKDSVDTKNECYKIAEYSVPFVYHHCLDMKLCSH